MQTIPLIDEYAQTITVGLGGQNCTINLYQKSTVFFCDLYVGGTLIVGGVLCNNWTKIVQNTYLGFLGDLAFYDTQGTNPPSSPGLGARYLLYYLQVSDLNGAG